MDNSLGHGFYTNIHTGMNTEIATTLIKMHLKDYKNFKTTSVELLNNIRSTIEAFDDYNRPKRTGSIKRDHGLYESPVCKFIDKEHDHGC